MIDVSIIIVAIMTSYLTAWTNIHNALARKMKDRNGALKGVIQMETVERIYLICLRCKKPFDYAMPTFEEMEYTKYSYCEECLREGLKLLRDKDKGDGNGNS